MAIVFLNRNWQDLRQITSNGRKVGCLMSELSPP